MSVCQGQFKIPFRREPDTIQSMLYTGSWLSTSYYEISGYLSNLHWLSCSKPCIFQANAHFFGPRSLLYRLLGTSDVTGIEPFPNPTRMISLTRLMCLLWILTIYLEYAHSPVQLTGELQDLYLRLRHRGINQSVSHLLLCWLLLRKEESLELHSRSWAVVRFMNVIKTWDVSIQHNLTALLLGYLLGNQTAEALQQKYDFVMEGILEDLALTEEEVR
jgi:hypothetical protein